MKKQVLVIHGGDTFEKYEEYLGFLRGYQVDIERFKTNKTDWKPGLRQRLGDDYEVILPVMPNKTNAQYAEWKIWMDKLAGFLNDGVVLVGHSMGASFLAKYLSESQFPKKIKAVFLVAGVFEADEDGHSLASFSLPEKLNLQTENIYLYHSKDDHVVPFSALSKFEQALPGSKVRVLEDRQHINQEEFPELVEDILSLN